VDAADGLWAGSSDAEDPVRHAHLLIPTASVVEVAGRAAVGAVSEWVNVTDSIALNVRSVCHNAVIDFTVISHVSAPHKEPGSTVLDLTAGVGEAETRGTNAGIDWHRLMSLYTSSLLPWNT
jgi:hypothetical protein